MPRLSVLLSSAILGVLASSSYAAVNLQQSTDVNIHAAHAVDNLNDMNAGPVPLVHPLIPTKPNHRKPPKNPRLTIPPLPKPPTKPSPEPPKEPAAKPPVVPSPPPPKEPTLKPPVLGPGTNPPKEPSVKPPTTQPPSVKPPTLPIQPSKPNPPEKPGVIGGGGSNDDDTYTSPLVPSPKKPEKNPDQHMLNTSTEVQQALFNTKSDVTASLQLAQCTTDKALAPFNDAEYTTEITNYTLDRNKKAVYFSSSYFSEGSGFNGLSQVIYRYTVNPDNTATVSVDTFNLPTYMRSSSTKYNCKLGSGITFHVDQ